MARPRLPLGAHGKVSRTEQTKNRWIAKARVRDLDGVTRLIKRRSPTGVVDKYGAQAEAALIDAVAERSAPSAGDLTGESMLSAVWQIYRAQLVADGKAPRTLDRYDYVAAKIMYGLGSIRLREATTQRLDIFIRTLNDNSGPSVARQDSARAVVGHVQARCSIWCMCGESGARCVGGTDHAEGVAGVDR